MTWILYDIDPERARRISSLLMNCSHIEILPYQEVRHFLPYTEGSTTLLVHRDAVDREFARLARIKRLGRHSLRFYCTEEQHKIPQVSYIPDDVETLVS